MRRILAVFLSAILVFTISFGTTISVYAGDSDPRIVVSSANADSGETKEITIAFENSPGVQTVKLDVAFPSDLTLVSFGTDPDPESGENAKLWVNYNLDGFGQQPSESTSPVTLIWLGDKNVLDDFTFATLKFKVADNTTGGDKNITVTYGEGDICNSEENDVDFEIVNGKISVPYPKIVVSSEVAARGDTKDITISFRNSPAISSARFNVAFPSDLTLVSLGDDTTSNGNNISDPDPESGENAKLWVNYNVQSINGFGQQPPTSASPVTLNWVSLGFASGDFVFATLKFKVDDGATIGDKDITVTYDADDISDIDENDVEFEILNGKIEVVACVHNFVNVVSPTYLVTTGDCTHKAVYYKSCSLCGAQSTETFEGDVDASKHDYVNTVDATYLKSAADCAHKAVYYKSCSRCGAQSTETFENGEFDTAHMLGAWENDALSHWKTCSVCAEKFENGAHIESDWIIDTPAGIGVAGSKHKECTVCGRVLASETIPALEQPKITAENKAGKAGDTIEINVGISNNPGIISFRNTVTYDESVLELVGVKNTGLLNGYTTPSPTISSPYTLRWADSLATEDNKSNGNIVTLTFKIKNGATEGSYDVLINPVESRNSVGKTFAFEAGKSTVTVVSFIRGDVDDDNEISDWDAILLNRYLAGWGSEINELAADVDNDGEVSDWDAIILERYLAGWDVAIS